MTIHFQTDGVGTIGIVQSIPGREPPVLNRDRTLNQLDPILWIVAKPDLDDIMIKIRHLNGAVNINAAAKRTALSGRRNRHNRIDIATHRRGSNRQGTIWALLGGGLRNRMIDRPLSRLRRIHREDRLIHAVRTQITTQKPIRTVNLDLLPYVVQL